MLICTIKGDPRFSWCTAVASWCMVSSLIFIPSKHAIKLWLKVAQKYCRAFHPMFQLYCVFYKNRCLDHQTNQMILKSPKFKSCQLKVSAKNLKKLTPIFIPKFCKKVGWPSQFYMSSVKHLKNRTLKLKPDELQNKLINVLFDGTGISASFSPSTLLPPLWFKMEMFWESLRC